MNQFDSDAREIAEQINDDGLLLAEEGDLSGALEKFSEASRIDPSYAEAYSNIGNCHRFLGKPDVALSFYNKAVELDPAASQPYYNRATIFEDAGDCQKAIADYETFLKTGGAERFGLEEEVRLAMSRLQAVSASDNALQMTKIAASVSAESCLLPAESPAPRAPTQPEPNSINPLPRREGPISQHDRRTSGDPVVRNTVSGSVPNAAIPTPHDTSYLEQPSESSPKPVPADEDENPEPYSGKPDSQRRVDSEDPPRRFMPIILDDQDDDEEEVLEEESHSQPTASGRIVFADPPDGDQDDDFGERGVAEHTMDENPSAAEAESEPALPTAEEIDELARLYFDRGVECYERGDIQGAIDNLSVAIDSELHSEDVYNYRGVAFMRQGKLPEAAEDFTNALRLNPESVEASANRGTVFRLFNELDRALADYERAISLQPGVAAFYYQRGIIHHKRKHASLAITDFDRALSIEPSNASVHYYRAIVLDADGRLDDAVRDYDKALKLEPGKTEAYLSRGLALVRLKRFGKAADDLNTYLRTGRGSEADIQLAQRALASIKPMLLT